MVNEHHTEQKLIRANPVPQPEHLHEDPSEAQALLALIMERRDAMTMTKQPLPIRPQPRPPWQSARIAAAAAVLVVLVIGAAALIGFAGDGSDTADQATSVPAVESTIPESEATVPPVTDTPAATPQTTTLQAEGPATLFDGSWQHQTSEQPFPRFEVVETSLGFFSRGDNIAGREGGPGVWFSPDGTDWQQVLTMPVGEVIEDAVLLPDEPPMYTIEASVRSLIEYDGAVYAFASIADPAHSPDSVTQQVAYRTTDGVEFEAITYSTEGGGQTFLVGENEMLAILDRGRGTSILRSEDGYNWTRHEPDVIISRRCCRLRGRQVPGGGRVRRRRRIRMGTPHHGGVARWDRVDRGLRRRIRLQRVPTLPDRAPGHVLHGGLYYDLEAETAQTGIVFHSEDGSTWERATMPAIADLAFVTDLISTEYGLLAVGWAGWSDKPARVVPMTTVDGTTFVELPHLDGLFNDEPGAYRDSRGRSDSPVRHRP